MDGFGVLSAHVYVRARVVAVTPDDLRAGPRPGVADLLEGIH